MFLVDLDVCDGHRDNDITLKVKMFVLNLRRRIGTLWKLLHS